MDIVGAAPDVTSLHPVYNPIKRKHTRVKRFPGSAESMAQVEESQIEGEGSPQMISLRSDASGNHVDDGEGGPSIRRKKRKKKDQRPESIIVYRSDVERAPGEDQGSEEGAERSTEEGAKFLCTPTGEGETSVKFLLKS